MRCACGHPSAADEALWYDVFYASFKAILNQCRLLHCSYVYAPYQVLKKCGIKGPEPSAFFGNYRLQKKMVGSCDAEMYIHVECSVWYYNRIVAKSYLLLLSLLYVVISALAMYMQGVLQFFEFLLKHHGPISGWATVLDVGCLVFQLEIDRFTMSVCIWNARTCIL